MGGMRELGQTTYSIWVLVLEDVLEHVNMLTLVFSCKCHCATLVQGQTLTFVYYLITSLMFYERQ